MKEKPWVWEHLTSKGADLVSAHGQSESRSLGWDWSPSALVWPCFHMQTSLQCPLPVVLDIISIRWSVSFKSDQVHVWQCLSSLAPSIKGQSFHLLSFFSHILSRTHLPIPSSVYGSQLLFIFLPSWPENLPSGFHIGVHGESGELLKSVRVMHVKLLYELK